MVRIIQSTREWINYCTAVSDFQPNLIRPHRTSTLIYLVNIPYLLKTRVIKHSRLFRAPLLIDLRGDLFSKYLISRKNADPGDRNPEIINNSETENFAWIPGILRTREISARWKSPDNPEKARICIRIWKLRKILDPRAFRDYVAPDFLASEFENSENPGSSSLKDPKKTLHNPHDVG